ncbi:MAG: hypothetical protein KAH67_07850, partial [Flavobacteriaceae bacterium]|nr:hypothetical protein [Flavobacteriaceae bacterium]
MLKYFTFLTFCFISITNYSQTNIAKQSFEINGDNWDITFSTPPCTIGEDSWNYQTSLGSITPSDEDRFWGIQDLNGECGGSQFETISFTNIDISEFRNITLSLDYNAFELDNGDDIKYEIFLNNISQGEIIL